MFDPSSQGQLQVCEDLKGPEVQVVRVVQVVQVVQLVQVVHVVKVVSLYEMHSENIWFT